jgi:predicted enzyme related to lactoylglutathione lyase
MADRKQIPGKFVWYELVTTDAKRAQAFYGEVLGWTARAFPMGSASYDMIYAGDTMIGGYAPARGRSQWLACVSVEDVDASAQAAAASGGRLIEPAATLPTVGRRARIADPQGAELYLFKSDSGDPPDVADAPAGTFFWNELHTTDPAKALAFYEKVVGFEHRSMDMGPGNAYHIVSRGGVDRGGATSHLGPGVPPHWLPYVRSEDPDAAIARARQHGGTIPFGPEDIPGIGRFGIMQDPTGALLAVMNPLPRQK